MSKQFIGLRRVMAFVVIVMIVSGVTAGIAIGKNRPKADTPNASTSKNLDPKLRIGIKSAKYIEDGGIKKVVGKLTNNDTIVHAAFLKATFYDATGRPKGTGSGAVGDIAPGQTKSFEIITTDDIAGYKTIDVRVKDIL